MKIVVVGLGYVGLSNAVLLAQHNEVLGVDISPKRVEALNARKSPIVDKELSDYLSQKDLNLTASTDLRGSVVGADYIIISTPTNYDEKANYFDTSSVEAVIENVISFAPNASIVVKSTIPVGFVKNIRSRLGINSIFFSPEFLREGRALKDNLFPSRIVIGEKSERAKIFANLLIQGALKKDIEVLFTGNDEAEAIKLFANSYLAMRVAFFNELDSYALAKGMDSQEIIQGVSLDPRIGNQYNNPSFGYGGYCLPKDTKQLLASFAGIPQNIFQATVSANLTRKEFLANQIINKKPRLVGIFRLVMKVESDNFRESAIQDIMKRIKQEGIEIIIYEPSFSGENFSSYKVEKDLNKFKTLCDIIITNRLDSDLEDVNQKVFTRDIFGSN